MLSWSHKHAPCRGHENSQPSVIIRRFAAFCYHQRIRAALSLRGGDSRIAGRGYAYA